MKSDLSDTKRVTGEPGEARPMLATAVDDDDVVCAVCGQICPFPFDLVRDEIAKYGNAQLCWAQEEHKNMGCWSFVQPRFHTAQSAAVQERPIKSVSFLFFSFFDANFPFLTYPNVT